MTSPAKEAPHCSISWQFPPGRVAPVVRAVGNGPDTLPPPGATTPPYSFFEDRIAKDRT